MEKITLSWCPSPFNCVYTLMSTLFLSNISWDTCDSHGKHHHLHSWWFQMFDQVYTQFCFDVLLSPITILTCFNFKFHDCIELLSFQFLIQFNSSRLFLIVVSMSYWIAQVPCDHIEFLFQFNIELVFQFSHKKHKQIQRFHNINIMNMERHVTCTFSCPIGG